MKLLLLFSLFLSGCTLPFAMDHLSVPEGKTVRIRRGDTLRTTSQELVRAGKIKNRGTIIVQAGTGNIAAPIEKSKAPVAVGEQALVSSTPDKKNMSILDQLKLYLGILSTILIILGIILLAYRFYR